VLPLSSIQYPPFLGELIDCKGPERYSAQYKASLPPSFVVQPTFLLNLKSLFTDYSGARESRDTHAPFVDACLEVFVNEPTVTRNFFLILAEGQGSLRISELS
jgi:hypothetical protein